jgi:hypothetical protein
MKARQFLTAALAMAAISPNVQSVKAPTNQGVTANAKQKEGIVKPIKSARQIVMQDAGGFQVMGYNPGIPPHIYGAYHVRRGTHKRTNAV